LDLLLVKIGGGIALIDPGKPAGGSGSVEKRGCQSGLPGVTVTDNARVADVLGLVDSHVGLLSLDRIVSQL
jgi:hypothetical protein